MVVRWLAAVGLVALVACGCGDSRRGAVALPRVSWAGVATLTSAQQAIVMESWEHHRAAWDANNGSPAPDPPVVFCTDALLSTGTEGGTWWGDEYGARVSVVVGARLEVPAGYHELGHVAIGDETHTDPRWARWGVEQDASVAARLAALP